MISNHLMSRQNVRKHPHIGGVIFSNGFDKAVVVSGRIEVRDVV